MESQRHTSSQSSGHSSQSKRQIPIPINQAVVQKYLNENNILIQTIYENQQLGKMKEATSYQMKLQQNLIHLATIADMDPRKKN